MARTEPRTLRRAAHAALVAAGALAVVACNGGGPTNQAPSLAAIADQRTTLGEPVSVSVAVTDEEAATVQVTAASSNEQVVPLSGLAVTGAGASRTLTVTPGSTTPGTAVVTVTATDAGGRSSTRQFEVVVDHPFAGEPQLLTPQNGDPVGMAVAMHGDVAVTSGDEYAYAFELVGDEWVEGEKFTSVVNGLSDVQDFGRAVAVEDGRVLVGAPDTSYTETAQGEVFVFDRSDQGWEFTGAILDEQSPEDDDRMGRSVGVSGDHLFAGAPGAAEGGVRSGSVFVYQPDPFGVWQLLGKLTPSDAVTGTVFGDALDVSGGLLVVGDYANDERAGDGGAAYVFVEDGGFWTEAEKLAPIDLEANDQFGIAVAADDGWVLVSAWNDDDQGDEAGAVYVFTDAGSGWELVDKLYASDAAPFGGFGNSLALDYPYAVVGAYTADAVGTNNGAVYVFRHDGETWHEVALLTSPQPGVQSGFGWDVDVSGDYLIVSQVQDPTFTAVYKR